ncbi:MAG: hypothetical protein WDA08_08920 [Weeksellaceae bacterium]
MKNIKYFFFPLVFIISGCYVYQPYSPDFVEQDTQSTQSGRKVGSVRGGQPAKAGVSNLGATLNRKEGAVNQKSGDKKENSDMQEEINKREEEMRRQQAPGQDNRVGAMQSSMQEQMQKEEEIRLQMSQESGVAKSKDDVDLENIDIKEMIVPNKIYKIMVEEKRYKIQADQWEGDTLVSHKLRNAEKTYRFHKDQIEKESVEQRRFSKPYSDIITVGAYVATGAGVLLLLL